MPGDRAAFPRVLKQGGRSKSPAAGKTPRHCRIVAWRLQSFGCPGRLVDRLRLDGMGTSRRSPRVKLAAKPLPQTPLSHHHAVEKR